MCAAAPVVVALVDGLCAVGVSAFKINSVHIYLKHNPRSLLLSYIHSCLLTVIVL